METWEDYPFDARYKVSNKGRVIGLFGRVLKGIPDKDGYKTVMLRQEGKSNLRKIHRMVAHTFVPNPDGKPMVCHKDGNPANNTVENLRWDTARENSEDIIRHGRLRGRPPTRKV